MRTLLLAGESVGCCVLCNIVRSAACRRRVGRPRRRRRTGPRVRPTGPGGLRGGGGSRRRRRRPVSPPRRPRVTPRPSPGRPRLAHRRPPRLRRRPRSRTPRPRQRPRPLRLPAGARSPWPHRQAYPPPRPTRRRPPGAAAPPLRCRRVRPSARLHLRAWRVRAWALRRRLLLPPRPFRLVRCCGSAADAPRRCRRTRSRRRRRSVRTSPPAPAASRLGPPPNAWRRRRLPPPRRPRASPSPHAARP